MNIKTYRKEIGLTQVELAKAMGTCQSAIAAWENGTAYPTADKLPKLARILGTTVDALLADDTNNDKEEQNV